MEYEEFLVEGEEQEKEFGSSPFFHGAQVIYSTPNEDMKKHWDVKIDGDKYDVKGLKKIGRTGKFYNEDHHVLEIKNVKGETGWLYGEADFFAFATRKYWIVVEKKKLQQFVKDNIQKTYVDNFDDSLYCLYRRRDGDTDIITMVKTLDLMVIANKIIDRVNPDYFHVIGESIDEEKRVIQRVKKLLK